MRAPFFGGYSILSYETQPSLECSVCPSINKLAKNYYLWLWGLSVELPEKLLREKGYRGHAPLHDTEWHSAQADPPTLTFQQQQRSLKLAVGLGFCSWRPFQMEQGKWMSSVIQPPHVTKRGNSFSRRQSWSCLHSQSRAQMKTWVCEFSSQSCFLCPILDSLRLPVSEVDRWGKQVRSCRAGWHLWEVLNHWSLLGCLISYIDLLLFPWREKGFDKQPMFP